MHCAQQGWTVVAHRDDDSQPAPAWAQGTTQGPLTTAEATAQAVASIEDRWGRLDGLVHCRWRMIPGDLASATFGAMRDSLWENAKVAFLTTQAVGRYLAEQERGSIVYVVSIHDEKPSGVALGLSMAHSAITMLAKEAALELGRHQVRVNAVEWGAQADDPLAVLSPYTALYDQYGAKVPSHRLGGPEDLAAVVEFLLNPASRHVHGAVIRADGGFLLHYSDEKALNATPSHRKGGRP
jgi:NAD(P)-dependent dehydrogenase (short-subunit alcohol dehydrogenase family)